MGYGESTGSRTSAAEPEWLTLGQAARYLGVAQSTIRKWTDLERLPAFKTPGGHRRYRRRDLDTFLSRSQPGKRTKGPLVLIVDDDAGLRSAVRAPLEREGYSVREAGSAEEGLSALEDEPPDLVLLDVMMPGMDGWEMLRRVQQRHGVDAVPVVMFSGKVDERSVEEATARGARGFLPKSLDPEHLVASAKQMLAS